MQVHSKTLRKTRPRRQEARSALDGRQAELSRLEDEGRVLDSAVRDAASHLEVPPRHTASTA